MVELEEMFATLVDLKADEFPCRQCVSVAINGIGTHENGCPARAKIRLLAERIARLEEDQ